MQYSKVVEKLEKTPSLKDRSLVVVLRGDAQRQDFCRENGITYHGQTLPEYLWSVTHAALTQAMEYQCLEYLDVLAIKNIATNTLSEGRKAISCVLETIENDALVNMVTHIGVNFARSVGVIFTKIMSNGSSNCIKLEIDESIAGIPRPLEYTSEHSSVFAMPKIGKDNARSAKVLARTLGLTTAAAEQRICDSRNAIRDFCTEDEVFQEAWG